MKILLYIEALFTEAKDSERFDVTKVEEATTKSLYISFTETMPPPKVELRYPERDWRRSWKRSVAGVLGKVARNILFLLLHDRVATRERGHRLMPGRYESLTCPRCWQDIETQIHRYATCSFVQEAWGTLRFFIDRLEPGLVTISDKSLLHLDYPGVVRGDTILWLLGSYLEYVEQEVVLQGRRVSSDGLLGFFKLKKIECRYIAMPEIGFIPGLETTGIG